MKIRIILQNKSPLSIRSDRADDVMNTLQYIPGHSFRGALAALYLAQPGNDSKDDLFRKYFIDETIRYSPLYPSNVKLKPSEDPRISKIIKIENNITNSPTLTKPLPKTAISCKRWPGFKGMGIHQEQHGVQDQLFEWAIYKLGSEKQEKITLISDSSKCHFPGCQEDMVSFAGFYKTYFNKTNNRMDVSARKVKTQISMHTGIMRSTGTVRPGILYSIESIQEDFLFTGFIEINDNDNNNFIQKFKDFLKNEEIRIGNKKTSGQGLCSILDVSDLDVSDLDVSDLDVSDYEKDDSSKSEDDFFIFKKRLLKFDLEFKKFAPKNLTGICYFSIDLFSEAILLNSNLNYEIGFKNLLYPLLPEAELIYENVSPFKVMGWNSVLKLPKQTEWAIEKGSVAFYKVPELSDEILKELYNLEKNRIGIRKTEGFGIIRISDSFHWEVR